MTHPHDCRPPVCRRALPHRRRSRWAPALGALLLLLAAVPAPARLTMTCVAGFEGWVKPGKWAPIFVTLENFPDPQTGDVADFVGTVEFELAETIGGPSVSFAAPIELPSNSRKLVTLYVMFTDTPRRPQLKLLRPGGSNAIPPLDVDTKTAGVRLIPTPEEPLILVIEPSFATPTEVPSPLLSHRQHRVARSDGAALPDQWYGFEAVDVVILPQFSESTMTDPQQDALVEWVRMGGRLLVMGGQATPSFAGSPFESILPATPLGVSVQEVGLAGLELEPMTLADATPGDGARTLAVGVAASGREVPLGWMRRVGLGEVHFWRYSTRGGVGQRTLRLATRSMWESVFRQRYHDLTLEIWREKFRPHLLASNVLEKAAEAPWIGLILALIAIYFLAVGPANFVVLRRKRRLELVWITIPAIVAVFSIGMYLVGILTMGNQNIRRDMSLLQMEANSPVARASSFASYFAAHARAIDVLPASPKASLAPSNLTMQPSLWVSEPWSDGLISARSWMANFGRASGSFEEAVDIVQGARMEMRDLPAAQWTWTLIEGLGPVDLGGTIDGTAIHRGTHLDGALTNNTGYDILRSVLLVQLADPTMDRDEDPGVALLPIGPLQKGGTVDLNSFPMPRHLSSTAPIPAELRHRDATTFDGRLWSAVDNVFLKQLVTNPTFPRGRAFLVALVDLGPTGRLNMMATAEESTHHGLLVVHLPMVPGANVELPLGSMTVIPTRHDDRIPPERSESGERTALELGEGRLVIQIESPFDPGTAVLSEARIRSAWRGGGGLGLAFTLHDNSRPGGLPVPVVETAGPQIPVIDVAPAAEYLDGASQSMFFTVDGNLDRGARTTPSARGNPQPIHPRLPGGGGLGSGRAELRALQAGGTFSPASH